MAPGDPLGTAIYEYDSDAPIIPSRISERYNHSLTTAGSTTSASAFKAHIKQRDGNRCVVSEINMHLRASHLIPKRLGTKIPDIVRRFSGEQAALGVHRYDPRINICLLLTVDDDVDNYELGFYHVAVSYCI